MKKLFESFSIKNLTIENRICVPPMVYYHWAKKGFASKQHINHYSEIASGSPGLIIQEATCVLENGRLHESQLGIWSDSFIPGLRKITSAVHKKGSVIFLQLHHAGLKGIDPLPLCPDDNVFSSGIAGRKMTLEDIAEVQNAFIEAGRRAFEAGYDGVELHGCHRYLLCQFLNSTINQRDDIYGQEPERMIIEIMHGIRKKVPDDFIIGIRLGAFEPALSDGLRHAKILEEQGIDFFDISYGFVGMNEPVDKTMSGVPDNYPYKDVIYAAGEFKKQCSVPVFAANGIRIPSEVEEVLAITDVDMVDVGRSILVDPYWPKKAKSGIEPGRCIDCRICQWRVKGGLCPGRQMFFSS